MIKGLKFWIGQDLSDNYIRNIFRMAMEEDVATTYFYSFKEINEDIFLKFAREIIFTVAEIDGRLAAFMTLHEIAYGIGNVTYYGFKWVRGKQSVDIGKAYLADVLEHFNTIIGISPIDSRISISFNRKIGMTEVGTIPGACYIAKEDKFIDGLLTQITK